MTEEHKRRISESLIGNKNASGKRDLEFSKKISEYRKGKPHSEDTRKKISESLKKKRSDSDE
jgi:hypothetical protein